MWLIYICCICFWKKQICLLPSHPHATHMLSLSYSSSSSLVKLTPQISFEFEETLRKYQVITPLHSKLINFSFIYMICDLHVYMYMLGLTANFERKCNFARESELKVEQSRLAHKELPPSKFVMFSPNMCLTMLNPRCKLDLRVCGLR